MQQTWAFVDGMGDLMIAASHRWFDVAALLALNGITAVGCWCVCACVYVGLYSECN